MYAIAINGSPRANGNTNAMLTAAVKPLRNAGWQTEIIHIGGQPFRGCTACAACMKNKDNQCILKDDPFNEIFRKMIRANAIIIGSPTYFTDVTAETKALLDRAGFVALANATAFAGKIGAAVVAVRRGGATHVFDTINHMFQMSSMIVPGSTYWNMGFGLKPGEVHNDTEAMANMNHLGRTIHWLAQAITPSLEQFPPARQPEEG